MPSKEQYPAALSGAQLNDFIEHGFIRIDDAFSEEQAADARAIMWRDIPCSEHDPASWRFPVVRLPGYGGEPFLTIANMPVLHAAFDQLVGPGRWLPRDGLGTFPVRFPHPDDPGDAGWHVDLSFPGDNCDPNEQSDFSAWRVNITSRGRALLTLFLFSDVGEDDAPTCIRVGSHRDMARYLEPAGEQGRSHMMLEHMGANSPQALATGKRELCISATPSSSTPRKNIAAPRRVSWRNLRSALPSLIDWSDLIRLIVRSRSPSAVHLAGNSRLKPAACNP